MNRIAVIGIIVEEPQEVEKLNQLLHEYGRSEDWKESRQKQFTRNRRHA